MEFCNVNSGNLVQAAEIHAISWRESHKSFCSAEFVRQHTTKRQAEYLLREMGSGKRLYMLIDPHPVGIVSIDENIIENLYVLPCKQRKGYGTKLLQFAIQQCVGIPTLWILSNNEAACTLYKKHGFQESGTFKQLRENLFEVEMRLEHQLGPEV